MLEAAGCWLTPTAGVLDGIDDMFLSAIYKETSYALGY